MKILVLIVLIYTAFQNSVDSAELKDTFLPKAGECGRINKDYLYTKNATVELDEHPWTAQFIVKKKNYGFLAACGATLISKRHLLGIGHCLMHHINNPEYETVGILLGKWRILAGRSTAANVTRADCRDNNGECTPPAQLYEIDDIALNTDTLLTDIAVIRLTKDVTFGDFVQPICLPPAHIRNGDHDFVSQFLYMTGFDLDYEFKVKTVAQMRNFVDCTNQRDQNYTKIRDQHFTGKFLCASCNYEEVNMLSGSALMAVNVTKAEPKHFYLVGLVSIGTGYCTNEYPYIFVNVVPFLKWIEDNLV